MTIYAQRNRIVERKIIVEGEREGGEGGMQRGTGGGRREIMIQKCNWSRGIIFSFI